MVDITEVKIGDYFIPKKDMNSTTKNGCKLFIKNKKYKILLVTSDGMDNIYMETECEDGYIAHNLNTDTPSTSVFYSFTSCKEIREAKIKSIKYIKYMRLDSIYTTIPNNRYTIPSTP